MPRECIGDHLPCYCSHVDEYILESLEHDSCFVHAVMLYAVKRQLQPDNRIPFTPVRTLASSPLNKKFSDI